MDKVMELAILMLIGPFHLSDTVSSSGNFVFVGVKVHVWKDKLTSDAQTIS